MYVPAPVRLQFDHQQQWNKWSFSKSRKVSPLAETSLVLLKVQQDNRWQVGQTILLSILPAGTIMFFMQVHDDSAYLPELAEDGIPDLSSGCCYCYSPQQQEQPGNWLTTTRPELNRGCLCGGFQQFSQNSWCGKDNHAHILTTLLGIHCHWKQLIWLS